MASLERDWAAAAYRRASPGTSERPRRRWSSGEHYSATGTANAGKFAGGGLLVGGEHHAKSGDHTIEVGVGKRERLSVTDLVVDVQTLGLRACAGGGGQVGGDVSAGDSGPLPGDDARAPTCPGGQVEDRLTRNCCETVCGMVDGAGDLPADLFIGTTARTPDGSRSLVMRTDLAGHVNSPPNFLGIPGLRQNPKILWADDAKIIGDGIAEALPVLGDFVAQEIERGVRKLSACGVAFVVRDVLVHDSP